MNLIAEGSNMPDLSIREAAVRLHVTTRFVQNLYAKGRLAGAYKLDPTASKSHIRIPEETIAALEALRRETATPQPQPK